MALDSLALALLMGLLAEFSDSTGQLPTEFLNDSATFVFSVELTETLEVEIFLADQRQAFPHIHPTVLQSGHGVFRTTSPDRLIQVASAWGVNWPFGGEMDYLSVIDIRGPSSWRMVVTIMKSLVPTREEEIRWSLTHGIF